MVSISLPMSEIPSSEKCPLQTCNNRKEKRKSLCAKHRKQKYKGTLDADLMPKRRKYSDRQDKSQFLSKIKDHLLQIIDESDFDSILFDLILKTKSLKDKIYEDDDFRNSKEMIQDLQTSICNLPKGN